MSVNDKQALIAKLESISALHTEALSIKQKMNDFEPEDNYERSVCLPVFPGEYQSEDEREQWEGAIDHTDSDAIQQMSDVYQRICAPKKPADPQIKDFEKPTNQESVNKQNKYGCFSKIALGAAGFCLLGSIVGVDDSTKDTLPIILGLVAVCIAMFFVFRVKLKKEQEASAKLEQDVRIAYEARVEEIKAQHAEAMRQYEISYDEYQRECKAFLDEYVAWRVAYLEYVAEESEIANKLEEDRVASVDRINETEFMPVLQKMAEVNDLVTVEYLPAIDDLIDLLKSGRADDLKEAINLYEEIVYRERQLQLEREAEEQRRYEEECRRQDEERRHREEMRFLEEQERQRQYEEERREREAERRHKEELEQREQQERARIYAEKERLRREEYKQHMEQIDRERKQQSAGSAQCRACINVGHCNMSIHNKTPNCTGFRPR